MKRSLLSVLLVFVFALGMAYISFATDYTQDITPPEMVVTDGDAYLKAIPPRRTRADGTYLWTIKTSPLAPGNLICSSLTGKTISTVYGTINIYLAEAAGGVPTVGVCYINSGGYITSVGKKRTTTLFAAINPKYKSGYTHYGFVKNESDTGYIDKNTYDYYGRYGNSR